MRLSVTGRIVERRGRFTLAPDGNAASPAG